MNLCDEEVRQSFGKFQPLESSGRCYCSECAEERIPKKEHSVGVLICKCKASVKPLLSNVKRKQREHKAEESCCGKSERMLVILCERRRRKRYGSLQSDFQESVNGHNSSLCFLPTTAHFSAHDVNAKCYCMELSSSHSSKNASNCHNYNSALLNLRSKATATSGCRRHFMHFFTNFFAFNRRARTNQNQNQISGHFGTMFELTACFLLFLFCSLVPATTNAQRTVRLTGSPGVIDIFTMVKITEFPGSKPNDIVTRFGTELPASEMEKRNYTFKLYRSETDNQRRFLIGPKDGIVRVSSRIDREECPTCYRHMLKIELYDGDQVVSQKYNLQVDVEDINDNAPSLVPKEIIIPENEPPGYNHTILGYDPDSSINGPPFIFKAAGGPEIQRLFRIQPNEQLDGGKGGFVLSALQTFDREKGKQYSVPVWVSDSGKPPKSEIRELIVKIGDKNDNSMSDGSKEIYIYNYEGELKYSNIGTVYVDDLDDWDVSSKSFRWSSQHKYFTLDAKTGDISVAESIPDGSYSLQVLVEDRERREKATGSVRVTVETIGKEAVENSASMKIEGPSPDDFIRKINGISSYDTLISKLAEVLLLSEKNIQIFSVLLNQTAPPQLDIRFAAFTLNSDGERTYLSKHKLLSALTINRKEIADSVKVIILQVGISVCFNDICKHGCMTVERALASGSSSVINANETAFVGVYVEAHRTCECYKAEHPVVCGKGTCLNRQPCHQPADGGFFCECRNPTESGMFGSRCEGTSIRLEGDGVAFLKPLPQCEKLHISVTFSTKHPEGVILYAGPMYPVQEYFEQKDYLILYLNKGVVVLKVDLGSGSQTVQLMDASKYFADGHWHTVDIIKHANTVIELMLDRCRDVKVHDKDGGASIGNVESCRHSQRLPGDNEFLTVNAPLQVGGLKITKNTQYPILPVTSGFTGCIRELRVNDELQDLYDVPYQHRATPGCGGTAFSRCLDLSGNSLCLNGGECLKSLSSDLECRCQPGFYGQRCEKRSKWVKFDSKSYMTFSVVDEKIMPNQSASMELLWIPGAVSRKEGLNEVLMKATGSKPEYMVLKVENRSHVAFEYDAGSGQRGPKISSRIIDAQRHYLHSFRSHEYSEVHFDNVLMGKDFGKSKPLQLTFDHRSIRVNGDGIVLGAQNDGSFGFQGCISGVRWNDHYFPMIKEEENQTSYATISSAIGVTNCDLLETCSTKRCSVSFICVEFWKGPFCTCPPETAPIVDDYGKILGCGVIIKEAFLGITSTAVAAILISTFVLFVLLLMLVVYSRRRRHPGFYMSPDDEARDRIVNYLEEGGEEDQSHYDISRLRKPVLPMDGDTPMHHGLYPPPSDRKTRGGAPLEIENLEDLIDDRLNDVDGEYPGPEDEIRPFVHEGLSSPRGSLSTLDSAADEDVDWNNTLRGWGPQFLRLGEMYQGKD